MFWKRFKLNFYWVITVYSKKRINTHVGISSMFQSNKSSREVIFCTPDVKVPINTTLLRIFHWNYWFVPPAVMITVQNLVIVVALFCFTVTNLINYILPINEEKLSLSIFLTWNIGFCTSVSAWKRWLYTMITRADTLWSMIKENRKVHLHACARAHTQN